MAAIWMRLRAELRSRWRSIVGLALLVGVAGGVVLAAAEGARRTASAFERLVTEHRIGDVLVNPDLGSDSALTPAKVMSRPQVAEASEVQGLFLMVLTPQGYPDADASPLALGVVDGRGFYGFDRPKLLEGRLPRRERADEMLINPLFARQNHLSVGDRFTLHLPADLEDFVFDPSQGPPSKTIPFDLKVAGIGVDAFSVVEDQEFETPSVFLTPAFWSAHPEAAAGFWGIVARLRRGEADIPAFRAAVESLVPDESIAFQTLPVTRDKVQRAVRPEATALAFFALAIATTTLLIVGQALARQLFVDSFDHPALAAIGFSRGQLFGLGMLRAAVVAGLGAIVAVVIALAASPLFPIGPARVAEPTPGLVVDLVVLGFGAAGLFAAILAVAVLPAWRRARTIAARGAGVPRASALVGALARGGAPAPAIIGVRQALEPGSGRTAVPVRTTIGAAAIGIASIIAALTFATSLSHLIATPPLYGWNWDVLLPTPEEGPERFERVLASDTNVNGYTRATISSLTLGEETVVAVGVEPVRGSVGPTIVSGRAPRNDTEVALGSKTMSKIGVSIGDTVTARYKNTTERLRVVGRVVLPGLGNYPGSDKTALGEGAILSRRALQGLGPQFGEILLVTFRPGISTEAARATLERRLNEVTRPADAEPADVNRPQRPSDVSNYQRVRSTPIGLAAVLGVLALAAVAHVLGAASRRRARDLAVLKTLGMLRRQVRATVAWQASTVALVALAVGVPVGIVGGRWIWSTFAEQLGTVAEPRTPAILALLAIPATLAACNLVAAFPARAAARTRPALVLRSE